MTLQQALSLCDMLEQLTRKGRHHSAESCVQLRRIEQRFASAPEADSYLLTKVCAAVDRIGEHVEAPLAHIDLRALSAAALRELARLRAAVLLCYEEPRAPAVVEHSPALTRQAA